MVDPSCQIQEASVAVKYAKQQKYSTFHHIDVRRNTVKTAQSINNMHVFPSLFCSQIGTVSGCLSNKTATRHYGKR